MGHERNSIEHDTNTIRGEDTPRELVIRTYAWLNRALYLPISFSLFLLTETHSEHTRWQCQEPSNEEVCVGNNKNNNKNNNKKA